MRYVITHHLSSLQLLDSLWLSDLKILLKIFLAKSHYLSTLKPTLVLTLTKSLKSYPQILNKNPTENRLVILIKTHYLVV